jgi:hypothetical protein
MPRTSTSLALVWISSGLACLGGSAACRSVSTQIPANLDSAVAAHADPVRAWEVRDDGRTAGTVVRYEDAEHPARGFFSVRNIDQQVLGIIDLEGRAWRYRPHQHDPEWLGTGTVAQATSWILGFKDACELREIPLESLTPEPAPSIH